VPDTDLRIVPVDAQDADNAEAWGDIHNTIIPASPLSADEVAERITRNLLTLAYDGDVLVGNATVRPPRDGVATVIVRILEPYRRRGHGSAYLERMLAEARALGAGRIETVVLQANTDGLSFARRHGFEEVERYEVDGAAYVDLVLRHSSASSA
jgi:GNAT superfamily N-acetyltransferase